MYWVTQLEIGDFMTEQTFQKIDDRKEIGGKKRHITLEYSGVKPSDIPLPNTWWLILLSISIDSDGPIAPEQFHVIQKQYMPKLEIDGSKCNVLTGIDRSEKSNTFKACFFVSDFDYGLGLFSQIKSKLF